VTTILPLTVATAVTTLCSGCKRGTHTSPLGRNQGCDVCYCVHPDMCERKPLIQTGPIKAHALAALVSRFSLPKGFGQAITGQISGATAPSVRVGPLALAYRVDARGIASWTVAAWTAPTFLGAADISPTRRFTIVSQHVRCDDDMVLMGVSVNGDYAVWHLYGSDGFFEPCHTSYVPAAPDAAAEANRTFATKIAW
jgi:hypothetical protein